MLICCMRVDISISEYQYGGWLYAMLVKLKDVVEEHQSCLMQHSA